MLRRAAAKWQFLTPVNFLLATALNHRQDAGKEEKIKNGHGWTEVDGNGQDWKELDGPDGQVQIGLGRIEEDWTVEDRIG